MPTNIPNFVHFHQPGLTSLAPLTPNSNKRLRAGNLDHRPEASLAPNIE